VILRGDKKVLLGQAVNILDLAQEAGAKESRSRPSRPPGVQLTFVRLRLRSA